jgi:SAM-dependent methyltransferase
MSGPDSSPDDWDRHWDDYADTGKLNPAQAYRRRLILALLGVKTTMPQILDIGSGQGDLAELIRDRYPKAEIVGLELSESGCQVSRRKVPDAMFVKWDLLSDPIPPEALRSWATQAVCSEVLEHVDDPVRLLANASAFLAPGCRLVVTVPGGPMSKFDRHIGHRRHYRRKDLRRLLQESGFAVDGVLAAGFPFHNLYRLAVIGRGEKLVQDASAGASVSSSAVAKAASVLFAFSFRFNLPSSPWGWQMIAVAHTPTRCPGGGLETDRNA